MSNQNKPSAADELHAYIAQNEAQQAAEQIGLAAQSIQPAPISQQSQTGASGITRAAQNTSYAGQTAVIKNRKNGNR